MDHASRRCIFSPRLAPLASALMMLAGGPVLAAGQVLPVPRIILYPGDPIGQENLVERSFDVVAPAAVHVTREGLVGRVARRTLLPGQPVPLNAVREPHLVTQGRTVLVVFRSEGLSITGHGVALQSGGAGEIISLRNTDSGSVVKGTVQADGSISVGAP